MNKKLILSFYFSLVILLTLTFYFFPRNNNKNKDNNNSQESLVQEENKEKNKEEEINKEENENEENLNNSQEKEEIKDEEIEEPMKINNYFSILIIVFLTIYIIFFFLNENDTSLDKMTVQQKTFYNFFKPFFLKLFEISRIETFLPSEIVCRIYGIDEIIETENYKKELNEIKKEEKENKGEENEDDDNNEKDGESKILECSKKQPNWLYISNHLFTIFINFLLLSLTSLPFLVITNGLKNFKKKFRWRYLFTSPFLFFRYGDLLMKITFILISIYIILMSHTYNQHSNQCSFMKIYLAKKQII